jgi:hypothetical protein
MRIEQRVPFAHETYEKARLNGRIGFHQSGRDVDAAGAEQDKSALDGWERPRSLDHTALHKFTHVSTMLAETLLRERSATFPCLTRAIDYGE